MLTVSGQERSQLIEIDSGATIRAVAFAANGKCIVSGGIDGVRVWRLEDRKQIARMAVKSVLCVAVSKDGKWIAAGTFWGKVYVWDINTYEEVFKSEGVNVVDSINGVNFSPDSTQLVIASENRTATVWDIAARKTALRSLHHEKGVIVAKYSPEGGRIATATHEFVRVYDSNDGRLLVYTKRMGVSPFYNTGLVWFDNYLFVVSDKKIKEIETSTGTEVSEWPVDDSGPYSCIAIPHHRRFIAYSSKRTITFWDTSTQTQLDHIIHTQDIHSIAFSSDDRFLAIGAEGGKITIERILRSTVSIMSRWIIAYLNHFATQILLHDIRSFWLNIPPFQEPDVQVSGAVLDSWKDDQLAITEALLTATISTSQSPNLLAIRALVQARTRQWDAAIVDAEEVFTALLPHTLTLTLIYTKSIKIQPSIIGYIAKSVALVGKGEKQEGYRTWDIAYERFYSTHGSFLLLLKVCPVHS